MTFSSSNVIYEMCRKHLGFISGVGRSSSSTMPSAHCWFPGPPPWLWKHQIPSMKMSHLIGWLRKYFQWLLGIRAKPLWFGRPRTDMNYACLEMMIRWPNFGGKAMYTILPAPSSVHSGKTFVGICRNLCSCRAWLFQSCVMVLVNEWIKTDLKLKYKLRCLGNTITRSKSFSTTYI